MGHRSLPQQPAGVSLPSSQPERDKIAASQPAPDLQPCLLAALQRLHDVAVDRRGVHTPEDGSAGANRQAGRLDEHVVVAGCCAQQGCCSGTQPGAVQAAVVLPLQAASIMAHRVTVLVHTPRCFTAAEPTCRCSEPGMVSEGRSAGVSEAFPPCARPGRILTCDEQALKNYPDVDVVPTHVSPRWVPPPRSSTCLAACQGLAPGLAGPCAKHPCAQGACALACQACQPHGGAARCGKRRCACAAACLAAAHNSPAQAPASALPARAACSLRSWTYNKNNNDAYLAYNKPGALIDWLQKARRRRGWAQLLAALCLHTCALCCSVALVQQAPAPGEALLPAVPPHAGPRPPCRRPQRSSGC